MRWKNCSTSFECMVSACHKTIAKKLIGASITEICECVCDFKSALSAVRESFALLSNSYIYENTHTQNHRGVKSDCAAEYHLNRICASRKWKKVSFRDICSRANPYSINYALFPNIAKAWHPSVQLQTYWMEIRGVRRLQLHLLFAAVTQPASATFTIFFVSPAIVCDSQLAWPGLSSGCTW